MPLLPEWSASKALRTHDQRSSVSSRQRHAVGGLGYGDAGQRRKLQHQLVLLILKCSAILPGRLQLAICGFKAAICWVSWLIWLTSCVTWVLSPACCEVSVLEAVLKAVARFCPAESTASP
jgi:hypothetical protein